VRDTATSGPEHQDVSLGSPSLGQARDSGPGESSWQTGWKIYKPLLRGPRTRDLQTDSCSIPAYEKMRKKRNAAEDQGIRKGPARVRSLLPLYGELYPAQVRMLPVRLAEVHLHSHEHICVGKTEPRRTYGTAQIRQQGPRCQDVGLVVRSAHLTLVCAREAAVPLACTMSPVSRVKCLYARRGLPSPRTPRATPPSMKRRSAPETRSIE
jgi:hypothetical protein